jgi:hypothetical protein
MVLEMISHQARVNSDQMVLVLARLEAKPVSRWLQRAIFCQAKAKGDYQDRVHSDQMVLVMVRPEAGPVVQWLNTLK